MGGRKWMIFVEHYLPLVSMFFKGLNSSPTTISKLVSETLQDPLGHLQSGFCYRATHPLCPRTKPNNVGREGGGGVKSLTSNMRSSDDVFISGGNPLFTNRFCVIVLGPTTISKI
ncbi:hypothetical protein MTR_1g015880 [Medicago truncatula]|uniref:Uncharacterized protein n=1 Tax=Medicago truncatula TaxID=3880 RepID=G7I9W0_MEDTR|nr:hypothetical protein MTR_1g015880 [Medicago truncatula]